MKQRSKDRLTILENNKKRSETIEQRKQAKQTAKQALTQRARLQSAKERAAQQVAHANESDDLISLRDRSLSQARSLMNEGATKIASLLVALDQQKAKLCHQETQLKNLETELVNVRGKSTENVEWCTRVTVVPTNLHDQLFAFVTNINERKYTNKGGNLDNGFLSERWCDLRPSESQVCHHLSSVMV